MSSKDERKKKLDDFLQRAGDLADEVIATFDNPALAEARWKKAKENRQKG